VRETTQRRATDEYIKRIGGQRDFLGANHGVGLRLHAEPGAADGLRAGSLYRRGECERSSGEVARLLKTDERATDRLMNALCSFGLLGEVGRPVRNTPSAARFLVAGHQSLWAA